MELQSKPQNKRAELPKPQEMSAYQAMNEAQKLAFAPVAFQVTRALLNQGVLAQLQKNHPETISEAQLTKALTLPVYSTKLLCDAGVSIGLILRKADGGMSLSKLGHIMLNDPMTRVNFNFIQDVCYEGLNFLEESLVDQKPRGLKVFGEWPTVYEGLSQLPEKVKKSWFEFDHYYSDSAFSAAIPHVLKTSPCTLLDIGGNTGRFSRRLLDADQNLQVTICDLPGQVAMAKKSLAQYGERVSFLETNILGKEAFTDRKFDVIWMSQFLDCFSKEEITHILTRCQSLLAEGGTVYVLETFCDRQPNPISEYCVVNTSLYFTCMANGNSRMYDSKEMIAAIEAGGFKVVTEKDGVGFSHTLLTLKPSSSS